MGVVVGARVVVGLSVTGVVGASVETSLDAVVDVVGARVVVGASVTEVIGVSVET